MVAATLIRRARGAGHGSGVGAFATPATVAALATVPGPTVAGNRSVFPTAVGAVGVVPLALTVQALPPVAAAVGTVPPVGIRATASAGPVTVARTGVVAAPAVATPDAASLLLYADGTPAFYAGGPEVRYSISAAASPAAVGSPATVPAPVVNPLVVVAPAAVGRTATVPGAALRVAVAVAAVGRPATVPAVSLSPGNASGIALPGALTGWTQTMAEDFATSVAVGGVSTAGVFPSPYASTLAATADLTADPTRTAQGSNSYFRPSQVVSVAGSQLTYHLHVNSTDRSGDAQSAEVLIKPGGTDGQTYGRFAAAMKVPASFNGWHFEFVLAPVSGVYPGEGKLVVDEGPLNGVMSMKEHLDNGDGTSATIFTFSVPINFVSTGLRDGWHLVEVEWVANYFRVYVDGAIYAVGHVSVPNSALHWQLRTYTEAASYPANYPTSGDAGDVVFDWIATWTQGSFSPPGATTPTGLTKLSEAFTGTDGAVWPTGNWTSTTTTTGASATIQGNRGRQTLGTLGSSTDHVKRTVIATTTGDFMVTGTVKITTAVTIEHYPIVTFRDGGTGAARYALRFLPKTSRVELLRDDTGSSYGILTFTAWTFTLNQVIAWEVFCNGDDIQVRVWDASTGSRPTATTLSRFNLRADVPINGHGISLGLDGGTAANASTTEWDDVTVIDLATAAPAAVGATATVGAPPLMTSLYQAGAVHTQHSLDSFGNATAVAAGKVLLANATDAENQHIMGFGTITPSVDSTHRDYVASGLTGRVNTVMAGAGRKVITFALAPAWMRDTTGQSPVDDFTPQAWFHAPPDPTHVSDFASLCANIASTYTDVTHFLVWNELKGLFNDTLNRWDYERYTTLYNAVYTAVKAARPDALIGGPYINLGSNIGSGSPVQDPAWGWVDQRLLDVMTYWLTNKTGADFIAVDGGNYTASGTSPTPFGKFRRFMEWLRGLNNTTYPGAKTLPVWIAEHYCYPPGATAVDPANTTDKPRYPAEWAVGTIEAIRAGYSTCMLWGPQGFDGDTTNGFSYPLGLFTDTQVSGGGQATTLHPVVKTFHDNYSAGTPIYIPQTGNANIVSIANPTTCTLINRANSSQSTSGFVGAAAQTLTAYEVRTIAWSPVGYQEQADTVLGTRWVDDFTSTANLVFLRGTPTVSSGKLRAGSTSAVNMATQAAAYDTPDHYAEVVVSTLTNAASEVGVGLRFVDATAAMYVCLIEGGGTARIYYYNGSSFSPLVSTAVTIGTLPGTLRGEVQGTAIRLYWRGSLVLSTSHSALTAGRPATYEYAVSNVANVQLEWWNADLL